MSVTAHLMSLGKATKEELRISPRPEMGLVTEVRLGPAQMGRLVGRKLFKILERALVQEEERPAVVRLRMLIITFAPLGMDTRLKEVCCHCNSICTL